MPTWAVSEKQLENQFFALLVIYQFLDLPKIRGVSSLLSTPERQPLSDS